MTLCWTKLLSGTLAVFLLCTAALAEKKDDRNTTGPKAGFAEIIITPKLPVNLAGYGRGNIAHGVHDDLYACAIYLENNNRRALIISVDLIGLSSEVIKRLKTALSKELSLETSGIFFTATHTHQGPRVEEDYEKLLTKRVLKVAKEADSHAQAFDLGFGFAHVDENMNRRFFLQSGVNLYISHHSKLTPITYNYTDQQVDILYFFPKGTFGQKTGRRHPFGVIVNYAVHPLVSGNTALLISADIPGVVRSVIRESLECPSLYITGAAGDLHPKHPGSGFEEMQRVGKVIGRQVVQLKHGCHLISGEDVIIKYMSSSITLKSASQKELDAIPRNVADPLYKGFSNSTPADEPHDVEVEYSLLALGPVMLFGVPGEWSAELGSVLKWLSPFKRNLIMYNSASPRDYYLHTNAYAWGGYETYQPPISPRGIRPLCNSILEAAEKLYDNNE